MEIEIMHRPSYSLAVAKLTPNERIRAEAASISRPKQRAESSNHWDARSSASTGSSRNYQSRK